MWKTNVIRQRIVLVCLGLLLLTPVMVVGWLTVDAPQQWLAFLDAPLRDAVPVSMPNLAIYGAVIFAAMAIIALALTLTALPKKPQPQKFTYHADHQLGISQINSEVIAEASRRAAQSHAEIVDATIRISGTTKRPVLYAQYTLRLHGFVHKNMSFIKDVVIPEMETALGAPFAQRHININFQSDISKTSRQVTLRDDSKITHNNPLKGHFHEYQ